jgi:hypothetical protein
LTGTHRENTGDEGGFMMNFLLLANNFWLSRRSTHPPTFCERQVKNARGQFLDQSNSSEMDSKHLGILRGWVCEEVGGGIGLPGIGRKMRGGRKRLPLSTLSQTQVDYSIQKYIMASWELSKRVLDNSIGEENTTKKCEQNSHGGEFMKEQF